MFKLSEEDSTVLAFTHGLEAGIRAAMKGKHHQPAISHDQARIVLDWGNTTIIIVVKVKEAQLILERTVRTVHPMEDPRSTDTILNIVEETRRNQS